MPPFILSFTDVYLLFLFIMPFHHAYPSCLSIMIILHAYPSWQSIMPIHHDYRSCLSTTPIHILHFLHIFHGRYSLHASCLPICCLYIKATVPHACPPPCSLCLFILQSSEQHTLHLCSAFPSRQKTSIMLSFTAVQCHNEYPCLTMSTLPAHYGLSNRHSKCLHYCPGTTNFHLVSLYPHYPSSWLSICNACQSWACPPSLSPIKMSCSMHGLCPPWGSVYLHWPSMCPSVRPRVSTVSTQLSWMIILFFCSCFSCSEAQKSPGFLLSRWWIYQRECRDCLRFFLESRTFKPSNSSLNEFSYFVLIFQLH